ncbi:MAG TPA: hypothetical protein PKD61_19565, partial [Polyangiaceae bacterium]|nr:hypothetical protein [Polyangiaceae bacterium]
SSGTTSVVGNAEFSGSAWITTTRSPERSLPNPNLRLTRNTSPRSAIDPLESFRDLDHSLANFWGHLGGNALVELGALGHAEPPKEELARHLGLRATETLGHRFQPLPRFFRHVEIDSFECHPE